jgi:hypothetical protein
LDAKNHLFLTLFFGAVFVGIRKARLKILHFRVDFALFVFFVPFSSIYVGVDCTFCIWWHLSIGRAQEGHDTG